MADNTIPVEGNFSAKWLSLHSALLRPQYLSKVYKTYGRGFDIMDFLTMTGKNGLVSGRTVKYFEQGHYKATVTTSTAIAAGNLGADISFKIAAGDYDANGNPAVRVGQNIAIPQKYQPTGVNIPVNYRVMSRAGNAGDYTFTAKPFLSAVAQIATEVPVGTKLSLGAIQFAPGTGLPQGITQSWFERSFQTTILKEALGIEGGFLSQQYWEPIEIDGKLAGYYNKMLQDAEFRLDDQLNEYIFNGQANGNATMVQDSYFGGSNKVLSGDGLWPMLDARAQPLWYTLAFEGSDYITAKNLLESQGVISNEIIFAMGSELYDDTDADDLEYISAYSGGSDLISNMTELGFEATVVKRNGVKYHKVKLHSFSNPFSLGNAEYDLASAGFMMPTSKVRVSLDENGKKITSLNNVELRFLGKGQENRTRVLGDLGGISGLNGVKAVNEYDGTKFGMLTEPIVLFTGVNQCIQIRKEA